MARNYRARQVDEDAGPPSQPAPDYLQRLSQGRTGGYLNEQSLLRHLNQQRMLRGEKPAGSLDEAIGGGIHGVKQTETPPLQLDPRLFAGRSGGGVETAPQGGGLGGIDFGGILNAMRGLGGRQQQGVPMPRPRPAEAGPPAAAAPRGVPGGTAKGGDPQLMQAFNEYAALHSQNTQYDARVISVVGDRPGARSEHPHGHAVDIELVDRYTGKTLPNYQTRDPQVFGAYQEFANGFKQYADQKYPEVGRDLRWGGYFLNKGPGSYGSQDIMHFDLGGRHGVQTLGGDWQRGLSPQMAQMYGLRPGGGVGTSTRPAAATPGGVSTAPAGVSTPGGRGVSDALVNWVAKKEAFSGKAFSDYGQTNIGYGTSARGRTSITEPEARAEMRAELQTHMDAINKINPNLPQGAKDALASLSFNTGGSWYRGPDRNPDGGPTLLGQVKAGNLEGMKERFVRYTKAGGSDLGGLITRRQQEVKMFDDPRYIGSGQGTTAVQDWGGNATPAQPAAVAPAAQPAPVAPAQAATPVAQPAPALPAAAAPPAAQPVTQPATPAARPAAPASAPAAAPQWRVVKAPNAGFMNLGGHIDANGTVDMMANGRLRAALVGNPAFSKLPPDIQRHIQTENINLNKIAPYRQHLGMTDQQMEQYGVRFEQVPGPRSEAPAPDAEGQRLAQLAASPAAQAYAQAPQQGVPPLPQERPTDLNLQRAQTDLRLTPQERALYERHLTNLHGPGGVTNPDGSRSSLLQVGFEQDGRTYNVPSVYEGKILPPQEAIARARAEGLDKFPSYPSQQAAESRYDQMHHYMERDTADYFARQPQQQQPPRPPEQPPQQESRLPEGFAKAAVQATQPELTPVQQQPAQQQPAPQQQPVTPAQYDFGPPQPVQPQFEPARQLGTGGISPIPWDQVNGWWNPAGPFAGFDFGGGPMAGFTPEGGGGGFDFGPLAGFDFGGLGGL